jgi:hypothetical protein
MARGRKPKKPYTALDPDQKIMWNLRVDPGAKARAVRLAEETGWTVSDIFSLALDALTRDETAKEVIKERKRAHRALQREADKA